MSAPRPVRVLAWLLAVGVVVAGGTYAAYALGYLDRYLCAGQTCTRQAALPPAQLRFAAPTATRPVLDPAQGPVADPVLVAASLDRLLSTKALGTHVGIGVADLDHDRVVWTRGAGSFAPASTLKLFTSLAALEVVGADTRFATTVTRSGDTLTLVGGGDPYLTATRTPAGQAAYPRRAALSTLADRTVAALRSDGVSSVRLGYDDSLFSGPAVSPQWPRAYITSYVTTPVSALWVDQGVVGGGRRTKTPARDAASVFADLLRTRGVTVVGRPAHRSAGTAPEVASVRSGTLAQVVSSLVEHSDNQAAEVVLRHIAIATGQPASFTGGTTSVRRVLTALGIPWAGIRIHDGSGLARSDRVTLDAVLAVLRRASALWPDLPVAGFSGSLTSRFTAPGTVPALGVVRAKTGTLSGVHGLAGTTVDAAGTSLAFVALTDKVKVPRTLAARATLDRIASALAACICSR